MSYPKQMANSTQNPSQSQPGTSIREFVVVPIEADEWQNPFVLTQVRNAFIRKVFQILTVIFLVRSTSGVFINFIYFLDSITVYFPRRPVCFPDSRASSLVISTYGTTLYLCSIDIRYLYCISLLSSHT